MQKRNPILALFSGIVLALAMPLPGWWPLAWVGLVPLFITMNGSSPRWAAIYGFAAGAAYFGTVLFWFSIFGYLPWIAYALLAAPLYFALFAVVSSYLLPNRIGWLGYMLVPAAWTSVQWLRVFGPLGFTWGSLAHLQANVPAVIQLASITGPWGIDFLVCAFNLALAGIFMSKTTKQKLSPIAVAAVLAAVVIGWGYEQMRQPIAGSDVNVAVIQGNLPQGMDVDDAFVKLAQNRYSLMTAQAALDKVELVLWPETTLPVDMNPDWDNYLGGLAKGCRVGCILGAYDKGPSPSDPRDYNSAFSYSPAGEKLGVYHKVHLVPYGEYVPLRKQMPWLQNYGIRDVDVLPGKSHNLLPTQKGPVGVSICFESLFPAVSRIETRQGAEALVVITNDSWFKNSQAAEQHLMMARLRAVENQRYLIRAAATGISAIIDPYGRKIGELGIFKMGIVKGHIKMLRSITMYTRIGDSFAYACAIVSLAGIILSRRRIKSWVD